MGRWCLVVVTAAMVAAACSSSGDDSSAAVSTTSEAPVESWYGVAAASPHATEAGMAILEQGGSAVDAAVAVQAVLGLVEPQSSGLGGGAFAVHHDAETGEMTVFDGREEAPAAAGPDLFLDEAGEPLGFVEASGSGRAVGVPGAVAMLAAAHEAHGELDWSRLFSDAARLARDGFEVTPRMADAVRLATNLGASDELVELYLNAEGTPVVAGDRFTNPAYADTVDAVAADWRSFYEGPIAEAVVAASGAAPMPGSLTTTDIAGYDARVVEPVCVPYRQWRICGAPPPSSGGIAVASMLGQLESFELAAAGNTVEGWHLIAEASQRAYADRDEYVADDRFVPVPTDEMLDPDYLAGRAAEIDPAAASVEVTAGTFEGYTRGADATDEPAGTTHFVVADRQGDVVSMTSSVESVLGSRRVAAGMVLNNQLTDFSFEATDAVGPVANRVEPGKRPRSSMAPTLVLDEDGRVVMALGSPGGSSIIAYVAKVLVATLDWGLPPDEAVALPNVVARSGVVSVEGAPGTDELVAGLTALGHEVNAGSGENSGLHVLVIADDGSLTGAADPRREGSVLFSAP